MRHVIIDTDPGIDDSIAILLASTHPEVCIDALTTVGGKVPLEKTTANALGILNFAKAGDIPVYQGAAHPLAGAAEQYADDTHGESGTGQVHLDPADRKIAGTDAPQFIVDHTKAHPGEITLVPIGPLTNIAKALEIDPTLPERVPEVLLMGGAEGPGNVTPSAEFNFWFDPEAAAAVMNAGFKKITLVGLDATEQAFITAGTRELLRRLSDSKNAQFLYQITQQYADFYWDTQKALGAELCDVLAIAKLIDDSLVETESASIEIALDGICRGRSQVARKKRFPSLPQNGHICTNVNTRGFFELLLTTLIPEEKELIEQVLAHEYR